MIRLYIAATVVAAIFMAYITGVHVGNVRCDLRTSSAISEQLIINTQLAGETNDAVFHTGVNDIRRILREKYTIAE